MDDPRTPPSPSTFESAVPPPWPPVQYAPVPSIPLGGRHAVSPPPAYPTSPPVYPTSPPVHGVPTATILTVEPRTVVPSARWAAGIAIVAAAGLAASTFLPWVRVDVEGLGLRSGNGWTNVAGGTSWGPFLLFLAVVAAVAAAPAVVNVRSVAAGLIGVGAAALALLLGAVQLLDIVRTHPGVDATLRYGVVSVVVAAAVTLIALVVVAVAGRPAKVVGPRAVGAVG